MRRILPILACLMLAIGLTWTITLQDSEAWATPTDQESTDQANAVSIAQAEQAWPEDLSNGKYGDRTHIRHLYTRPYELRGLSENASKEEKDQKPYNTVPISVANPVARGYDFAVRYIGNTNPTLVLVYMGKNTNKWAGWTTMAPNAIADVNDGTGQKVAFYSWSECAKAWSKKNQQGSASSNLPDFDCIVLTIGESAAPSASCKLVEVVELDGGHNPTIDKPTMRARGADITLSGTLVKNLYAGYNLGGHFESNWQEKDANGSPILAKDGGWSRSDLELEVNFSRGTYITKRTISDIKNRGFKAIRLPVSWYQHIYEIDGGTTNLEKYHIDQAWLERIHEVVDWCLEEDLYVIIDTHHETWYECADMGTAYNRIAPEFEAVWTQIANEFDGYDQRLIFEGMNEPHAVGGSGFGTPNDGEVTTVNLLNRDFVNTIRNLGDAENRHDHRLLMVTPYCGGMTSQSGNTTFALPTDQNAMMAISVHSYNPHSFTHFENDKTYEQAKLLWPTNLFTDSYRESQSNSFNNTRLQVLNTFKNVPVIYGEFGSYYCGESRQLDRLEWSARHIAYIKMMGAPAIIWGMDRSPSNSNDKTWNVYDEDKHEWSANSAQILDMWFEILNDDDIPWGSWTTYKFDEHTPFGEGTPLVSAEKTLDKPNAKENDDYRVKLSPVSGYGLNAWDKYTNGTAASALTGAKEIAVEFTGTTPYLWLATVVKDAQGKDDWIGWLKVQPQSVIEPTASYGGSVSPGTAYFSAESIRRVWCSGKYNGKNFTMNDLALVYAATDGTTTVTNAYLLNMPDVEWGTPYYKWNSDYKSVMAIRFCKTDPNRIESETVTAEALTRPPTCEDTGETGYISAEFTNPAFVMQNTFKLTAPLGHDWDDGVVTKEPTADEEGEMTYTCKRDSSHKRTEPIPATGDYGDYDDEDGEGASGVSNTESAAAQEAAQAAARANAVANVASNVSESVAAKTASNPTNKSAQLGGKQTDKQSKDSRDATMSTNDAEATGSDGGSPFDDRTVQIVVAALALTGIVGASIFFVKALR